MQCLLHLTNFAGTGHIKDTIAIGSMGSAVLRFIKEAKKGNWCMEVKCICNFREYYCILLLVDGENEIICPEGGGGGNKTVSL